ncbi:MAG TPA: hypothetical protein VFV38_22150 [Ktedonobacteraceae bacterium]|nr:hypothetical protein [Ktedonobacteraceae bacterium]
MAEAYDLVRRVFGCEIPPEFFNTKYHQLPQGQQDRLYRVARRVWLTFVMRYQVFYRIPFENPNDEWVFHYVELPSLELYYLFTCIDTLASKGHMSFPDWLRQESVRQSYNLDGSVLTPDEVISLYQKYEDGYGINRNLRKLFNNLPSSLIEWLARVVTVRKINPDSSYQKIENPTEIATQLREYFYQRRNDSTHESKVSRPYVSDNIISGDGWWHFTSTSFEYTLRNKKQIWSLLFRDGIDEASILRVIIFVVVLQQMNIEVTATLVESYFESLSRQSAIYGFLDEMERTTAHLRLWETYSEEQATELDHLPIPLVKFRWASLVSERWKQQGNGLEQQLRGLTHEYINAASYLNAEIERFNQEHSPTEERLKRRKDIAELFQGLTKSNQYIFIIQMPFHSAIPLIKILADNPAYN